MIRCTAPLDQRTIRYVYFPTNVLFNFRVQYQNYTYINFVSGAHNTWKKPYRIDLLGYVESISIDTMAGLDEEVANR